MKWKLSIPESPMPVYYWAKFIGLAPFTVKDHRIHPPTLLGKLYPMTVAAAYLFFVSTRITPTFLRDSSESGFKLPSLWILSGTYTAFTTTFFTLIMFALSYEKITSLINDLCTISNEIKTLSIEEKCGKLFKNIFLTTATTNAVIITLVAAAHVLSYFWDIPQSIEYGISRLFTMNIFLIYAQVLICIGQRFRLLNERLLTVLEPAAHRVGAHHDWQAFAVSQRPGEENQTDDAALTDLQSIRKIEALHLELCDLVDQTIHLFGIPIILNAFELFVTSTLSCFWMYYAVVKGSHDCDGQFIRPLEMISLLYSALRIIIILLGSLIIAYGSSTTCEQGNATAGVLFEVWNKFKPLGLKDEFAMFSVQTMQKPVVTSVLGIFNVDYSYIYKIVCTGVAYIIVLIQLGVLLPCP